MLKLLMTSSRSAGVSLSELATSSGPPAGGGKPKAAGSDASECGPNPPAVEDANSVAEFVFERSSRLTRLKLSDVTASTSRVVNRKCPAAQPEAFSTPVTSGGDQVSAPFAPA